MSFGKFNGIINAKFWKKNILLCFLSRFFQVGYKNAYVVNYNKM